MNGFTHGRDVNAAKLWIGGAATAVVAAMIILVGVLLVRAVLNVPVLAPEGAGYLGGPSTVAHAAAAAAAALLATALLHLLLFAAPAPLNFFGWIVVLATAVTGVLPFTGTAPLPAQVAIAAINVIAGLAVISLLSGVGSASVRRHHGTGPRWRPVRDDGTVPGTGYTRRERRGSTGAEPTAAPVWEAPPAEWHGGTDAEPTRSGSGSGPYESGHSDAAQRPADHGDQYGERPTTHYPRPY